MAAKTSCKKFVIDASIVIKWFADDEEDGDSAKQLNEDFQNAKVTLLAPALVAWELGNFFGRVFTESAAIQSFNIFKNYGVTQLMLSLEGTAMAFQIMKKCPGVSFYDASYHALAIQHEAVFLTADKKYFDKAKKLGQVMLLKAYQAL